MSDIRFPRTLKAATPASTQQIERGYPPGDHPASPRSSGIIMMDNPEWRQSPDILLFDRLRQQRSPKELPGRTIG
jgi:hypothetical protein